MDQEKLNSTLKDFYAFNCYEKDKLNIVYGEYLKSLTEILVKNIYFGKVAVFALQDTFLTIGSVIKKELRNSKINSIDYILSGKEEMEIDTLSKTFALPEDIRAVICLDSKLSKICDYFAFVKKMPVIDISSGLDIGEFLENTFYLKNGDTLDLITVNPKKTVIVDRILTEKLNISFADTYSYVMKNLLSVLDIRINAFYLSENLNAELINLKNKAIIKTFSIIKYSIKERYDILVLCSLTVGLVNMALNKDYLLNSSLENFSLLYYGLSLKRENELFFSEKILSLYAELTSIKTNIYSIPDYNGISKEASILLNVSEETIIDNIIDKFNIVINNKKSFKEFNQTFSKEFSSLSSSFKKVASAYTVLGGKDITKDIDEKRFVSSIKNCGAISNINGITLCIIEGLFNI